MSPSAAARGRGSAPSRLRLGPAARHRPDPIPHARARSAERMDRTNHLNFVEWEYVGSPEHESLAVDRSGRCTEPVESTPQLLDGGPVRPSGRGLHKPSPAEQRLARRRGDGPWLSEKRETSACRQGSSPAGSRRGTCKSVLLWICPSVPEMRAVAGEVGRLEAGLSQRNATHPGTFPGTESRFLRDIGTGSRPSEA